MQNRESMENRQYDASPLPIFAGEDVTVTASKDELIALYEQICSSWHVLIDIRFKLLGFVPVASVVLLANLLASEGAAKGLSRAIKIGIAVLGLVVTLALWIYELRNSELHNELIGRGKSIEELWGIHAGLFNRRLEPSNWLVNHNRATALIYGSAVMGWAFGILAIVFEL